MTDRVHPNKAMQLALRRLGGHGIDVEQDSSGGPYWVSGCPAHEGARTGPVVRWDQRTNGTVAVHPHQNNGKLVCPVSTILLSLAITDTEQFVPYSANGHSKKSWGLPRNTFAASKDPFSAPTPRPEDSYAIFERLKTALREGEYAEHRADTGRYKCPACGAKGDGHGLRITHNPNPLPGKRHILLVCDSMRCEPEEILAPLDMTVAELCAADDVDDLGEDEPQKPSEAPDSDDPQRGDTWNPVDLTPFVDGNVQETRTSVGWAREDALTLLYAGLEHSVIGEMEAGKSWWLLACATAELLKGNRVVYIHFEEANPKGTVERLHALAVPRSALLERFTFIGPNEPVTPTKLDALVALAPSLVILDGMNEAMSMHAMSIRDEDEAAAYRRVLVKPFTRVGSAVISADHVVKDRDKRGRDALGSIHKGNGLTGSLILLENVEPFGRGQRGASHVFITKDRPGYLRQKGNASGLPGKTYMGTIIVDDTRDRIVSFLEFKFTEPKKPEAGEEDRQPTQADRDDAKVFDIITELAAKAESGETTYRKVKALAPFGQNKLDDCLERLVMHERITERRGEAAGSAARPRLFQPLPVPGDTDD